MPRAVFFLWEAEEDLAGIHRYIADIDRVRADKFLWEIEHRCQSLVDFPLQGRARNDLGPGYRVLFLAKRRIVMVYRATEERIEVLRVFYGGRDHERIIKGRGR